jgi:hypothetical protein
LTAATLVKARFVAFGKQYGSYVLVFVAFAIFRGIAEIQAGDLPVGWDSINYYTPWAVSYTKYGIFNYYFLAAPPFVFVLLIPLYSLTSNIWLSVKLLAPVLYGVLGLSVFYFAQSYLSWNTRKSALCSMLLMFQPAAIRISWDLFKNELAVALLFFQLSLISRAEKRPSGRRALLLGCMSLLIVLSHQFVAVLYFAILLSLLLLSRKKTRFFKKYLLATNAVALGLFLIIAANYMGWGVPLVSSQDSLLPFTTIHYTDFPNFSIFRDYMLNNSYSAFFAEVVTMFVLLFALILPITILGFWNDQFLTPLVVFLMIGSFLPLVSPNFAFLGFDRWMWMLAYVFPYYAVNGIYKLTGSPSLRSRSKEGVTKLRKVARFVYKNKAAIAYISFIGIFGASYAYGMLYPFYEPIEPFVPTSISHPILSSNDVKDITANVKWVNNQYLAASPFEFSDNFDNLSSEWDHEGNGTILPFDSTLTLTTTCYSGAFSLSRNLTENYFGTVEITFKFNNFSEGSHIFEFLTVRRTNGCGGGTFYFNTTLEYRDFDSSSSYNLGLIDEDWHTMKVTFNETCKLVEIDGFDKLCLSKTDSIGYIALGRTLSVQDLGGSVSIGSISFDGYLRPCLVSFFRELGTVWMSLDERIEIITYSKNLDDALAYVKNNSYTQIYLLLPTSEYSSELMRTHERALYSIYTLNQGRSSGDPIYFELSRNKPQSGSSWVDVVDAESWSGVVMKASASSQTHDTLFGPYIFSALDGNDLSGGQYVASFKLKITSNLTAGDVACVDVTYNYGTALASMVIKSTQFKTAGVWQVFQLPFVVPCYLSQGLEFRVTNLNNGTADLYVDYIQIEADTSTVFLESAQNKPQSGSSWVDVVDAESWSGIAMKASASSLNGGCLFGPYITFGKNGYSLLNKTLQVIFRLKVASNLSSSDVFCVDVAYNAGSILTSMSIKANAFEASNIWQDFELNFTAPESLTQGLEFRIQNMNNGITNVFVDRISLRATS